MKNVWKWAGVEYTQVSVEYYLLTAEGDLVGPFLPEKALAIAQALPYKIVLMRLYERATPCSLPLPQTVGQLEFAFASDKSENVSTPTMSKRWTTT